MNILNSIIKKYKGFENLFFVRAVREGMIKYFPFTMIAVLLFSLSACSLKQPSVQTLEPSVMPEVTPAENLILQADSASELNDIDFLNETFTVISDTFTYAYSAPDASIFIEYIQVTGLSDLDEQERINDMLCQSVNSFELEWGSNPEISDLKTYEIYAEYAIIGNLLSLQERLSYYHSQAAHPWVALKPMTIDISTGNKLKLSDIMILSDNLSEVITEEIVRPVKVVLDEHDDDMMRELFYDRIFDCIKDGYSSEYGFYLTAEAIGFIMEVPHAVGDYWTFEIAYDDLLGFLKLDFQRLRTQA